ncbi:MAG TPA: aldose 1-epimerase [Solirubrobacteraceae bacterium]|jgi:galactose mutarotase-like enzyme|nr:aldose 1-epimerase [Solirubrobacteraceae bacterium]
MTDHATVSAVSADGSIRAELVPGVNMICCSLRIAGGERLAQRTGLDAYAAQGSTMGIPLLYPWANRLGARQFRLAGKSVNLPTDPTRIHQDGEGTPLHGLAPSLMVWEVTESGVAHANAALQWDSPELLELFPFAHRVFYEAELEAGSLTVHATVDASLGDPVPVSFGFHPYLLLAGAPRSAWEVRLPRCRQLELDARMLPTGARMEVDASTAALATRAFDDAYELADATATFIARAGDRRITVEFLEGFPFAQVFSPPGADFVCFEPMTAPANALISGDGLIVLEPGQQHRAGFRVTLR